MYFLSPKLYETLRYYVDCTKIHCTSVQCTKGNKLMYSRQTTKDETNCIV